MKFKYYILIFITVSLFGCELVGDISDIKMKNVSTDKDQIKNARSVESSLGGVYDAWRNQGIYMFPELLGSMVGTRGVANVVGSEGFMENDVKTNNEAVFNNYMALFAVINTANSFITNLKKKTVSDLSEERRKQALAEARCHRAFAHFNLLINYGEFYKLDSEFGIVTYDYPVRSNNAKQRETVLASYDFIIKDLKEALPDLSNEVRKHYILTPTFVKSLLSKIYLYKADYVNSVKWAKEALEEATEKEYTLEDNYLDIFQNKHNSKEALFAPYSIQPENDLNPIAYGIIEIPNDATIIKVANKLVEGEEKDYRFSSSYNSIGGVMYLDNKYPYLDGVKGSLGKTRFMLRLAEVYLIAAEAEFRKEGGDKALAKKYLQKVATRAGYAEDYASKIADEDFLELLLKHKYIELCNEEGEAWYDLVRYKVVDNMKIAPDYVKSDKHLLFPLAEKILAGNSLLKQNPGY